MQKAGKFLELNGTAFFSVITCALFWTTGEALPESVAPVTATTTNVSSEFCISTDRFLSHIAILAHDEFEGRGTGERGIDLAAGYIAGHFAAAGLKPGGPKGTYFQTFTIPDDPVLKDETKLAIAGTSRIDPKLRTEFIPFGFSAPGEFSGDAVFVGYGCINPEKNYDDYAGMDVTGKVLLMFRREPPGWGGEGSGGFSTHARFETKMELAHLKGAAAVIIVNQKPTEDNVDMLMPFGRGGGSPEPIPALHVRREIMEQVVALGGLSSLDELQKQLDETGKQASKPLKNVRISGTVALETKDMTARNVIGVLPATGKHADEYVVIGGHYDHLGIRRGQIYNGADDNASGTSAVIELAYALSRIQHRARSIIFMTFTGEEMGLHGSRHFTKNPTVPIGSVVGMINMDMIGRLDSSTEDNMLAIHGLGTGSCFKEIVDRETGALEFKFMPDDSAIGPSDHDAFYKAGVPSLFFFTGVHDDYHQPGDDIEKVNADGGARITELVGRVAMGIVNAAEAPKYAEVSQPAKIFRGSRGGGVVMGIVPDSNDESGQKGWRIAQVMPNGGAAKSGMKAGDRILTIEGQPINGLSDYRDVTREKKAGDIVAVTVLREKEELELKVELGTR